jgi:hypothetical protein
LVLLTLSTGSLWSELSPPGGGRATLALLTLSTGSLWSFCLAGACIKSFLDFSLINFSSDT